MNLFTDLVDTALATTHTDAVDVLRAFFLFASCTILSVNLFDALRLRFVPYGARVTAPVDSGPSQSPSSASLVARGLDYLATLRVPHSYFTHFYIASVLSSIFWAAQVLLHGSAFQAIASRIHPDRLQTPSMSVHQVMLCWFLMLVQGVRRFSECLSFSKPSSSRMWFVHWLVGIAFYVAVAVGVWIEGTASLLSHDLSVDDVKVTMVPSFRTFLCLPLFLFASGVQHDCHHYLFSLKKYSLPTHPLFRTIICPHYTAECVIYLSLALLAAPPGELVNKTLLAALGFVAINLGVTAGTTKKWYMQKFGADAVRDRWNMLPGVY
ncbi:protein DFG10 [Aspergillus floccosus]